MTTRKSSLTSRRSPSKGPRPSRAEADANASLPLCALVGRPNVGKSSLFNRLVGGRPALVEDMPGVTRDRRYGLADWGPAHFRVVDTGGLDPGAVGILKAMRAQTLRAVDEATVVIFVVDAIEGITTVDEDVAALLRRAGKPVLVAVNKVDNAKQEVAAAEAYQLGFDQVFPLSASHGRGVGEMLDALVPLLGPEARARRPNGGRKVVAETDDDRGGVEDDQDNQDERPDDAPIRLAFVGKPNVGKSSLVNRLLGEDRVLVHDAPGTTRDPIDTPFSFDGRAFILVDTAGMRRRRSIDTLTEHVAAKMARDQLSRCDVAVLVIDAREAATSEDAKLASLIEESGRAALLVLNKKDLVGRADVDQKVTTTREEMPFMKHAPVLLTSAVTGAGVTTIPTEAARVFAQSSRRISTGELNKLLEQILAHQPPPAGPGGRHVRLYYITQASTRPPTFFISANHPASVTFAYRRFLVNQLRKAYGFDGSPVRIILRAHKQKRKAYPRPEGL
ncbi:MAG TPA: ribosome biogenesis GTPase Der [Polyangia bacterium]|jgi:GTP-binding protein|nr:ribosome biogenesis GTPase Der [Polyangia bacterium]